MESPQKKAPASTMDGSKAPHLLPVTLAKKTPRPDVVRRVSAWVLITAGHLAFSFALALAIAYALDHFHVQCSQSSFLRCDQLTDAQEAVVNALGIGVLCFLALRPAAAVLALRLPCCRHSRRALAYLALLLTIVEHCILAAIAHILLVADPGDILFRICSTGGLFVYAAGDIISFLVLLLVDED